VGVASQNASTECAFTNNQRKELSCRHHDRAHHRRTPVYETGTRTETYTVRKPIVETVMEEEEYVERRRVKETSMREETYTERRTVYETTLQEQRRTVRRPVYETVFRSHHGTLGSSIGQRTTLIVQPQIVNEVGPTQ
jgi:hypothetical protein